MKSWTLLVTIITPDQVFSENIACESWHEALAVAEEIMEDYADCVLIRVIDPRGWSQEVTKPMFRM